MIEAIIFDLDGTLVQTEKLKALSYAKAAIELCPYVITKKQVIESFKKVVGRSRWEVAKHLIKEFDLQKKSEARMNEFGVNTSWQAFVHVRLRYYQDMLKNPQTILDNQWSHNVSLLKKAKEIDCKIALATMSNREQAQKVLNILNIRDQFDFIATRDDVNQGKPNPEIYDLVSTELVVKPSNCLVIEDSPNGVKAALDAGMWCIAVSTPFTRNILHTESLLEEQWIVDDPDSLLETVDDLIRIQSHDK
jgi:HAD superfamily hydrolase (TIGR01509 family)